MSREQFENTVAELREHCAQLQSLQKQVDQEFEGLIHDAWKDRFPRRRKFSLSIAHTALGAEDYEAIREKHWTERCVPLAEAHKAKEAKLKATRDQLAESLTPQSSDEWVLWDTVWSSTYSTQGFGAITYAKNAAETKADHARFYGLDVEVRRVKDRPSQGRWGVPHADFQVWVKTTETDLTLLECKPGPSLREQVRLCWKRGVNPRVYNPFLPFGYEERVGLDYFGNDLFATP